MTTASVSFRITRHAEDLAHTIHALSQRVVQLEQRIAFLEDHLATPVQEDEISSEQEASLTKVEQLLQDCRELLAVDPLHAADHQEQVAGQMGAPSPLTGEGEKEGLAPFGELDAVA
jgi:hypothetical protein